MTDNIMTKWKQYKAFHRKLKNGQPQKAGRQQCDMEV
jgi:hypothetical protein